LESRFGVRRLVAAFVRQRLVTPFPVALRGDLLSDSPARSTPGLATARTTALRQLAGLESIERATVTAPFSMDTSDCAREQCPPHGQPGNVGAGYRSQVAGTGRPLRLSHTLVAALSAIARMVDAPPRLDTAVQSTLLDARTLSGARGTVSENTTLATTRIGSRNNVLVAARLARTNSRALRSVGSRSRRASPAAGATQGCHAGCTVLALPATALRRHQMVNDSSRHAGRFSLSAVSWRVRCSTRFSWRVSGEFR
jgi:hypothetical protein